MLLTIGVLALVLGVVVQRAHRQRRAVDAIEQLGGAVWYDFHYHEEPFGTVVDRADTPPTNWTWARRWLDKHYFDTVWRVDAIKKQYDWDSPDKLLTTITGPTLSQTEFTRTPKQVMDQVGRLPHLKTLDLSNSLLTDADLESIRGLSELEELNLEQTLVTDSGMENVRGLKRLKSLRLYNTDVTEECCEELRRALPDSSIGWRPKK